MIKKVKFDEEFLVKHSKEIWIDPSLPLKLQKRKLLETLGFPLENSELVPVRDHEKINMIFAKYVKDLPFMIAIHLKPTTTLTSPYFLVKESGIVEYRDELRNIQIIDQKEMFEKMKSFPQQSWVGFIKLISTSITGRLVYSSFEDQIIEIQKGVLPGKIGQDIKKSPYLCAKLRSFNLDFHREDSGEYDTLLVRTGEFKEKKTEIEEIIASFKKHKEALDVLRRIANLPTVEFGYKMDERRLIVIDVDWPGQYQY